ncbi:hypothetical protein BC629DRAFT_19585 [Irpex lacteus]|nr:hypothetical protein BC629DRAFT_19585 [Irpex lacteus]
MLRDSHSPAERISDSSIPCNSTASLISCPVSSHTRTQLAMYHYRPIITRHSASVATARTRPRTHPSMHSTHSPSRCSRTRTHIFNYFMRNITTDTPSYIHYPTHTRQSIIHCRDCHYYFVYYIIWNKNFMTHMTLSTAMRTVAHGVLTEGAGMAQLGASAILRGASIF